MVPCPRCFSMVHMDTNFCPNCGYNMQEPSSVPVEQPEPKLEPEPPTPVPDPAQAPALEPEPVFVYEPEPEVAPIVEPLSAPQPDYASVPVSEPQEISRPVLNEEPALRQGTANTANYADSVDADDDDDNGWHDAPIDEDDPHYKQPSQSPSSWLVMLVIAIVSLAVGALLNWFL